MNELFYSLKPIIPYIIWFPIFLSLFILTIVLVLRKEINPKRVGFYGLFLKLDKVRTIAISLLILQYFFVLESVVLIGIRITHLLILLILGIVANLLVSNCTYLIVSFAYSFFIYFLLFFENIFVSYTREVDNLWYIRLLIMAVCMLIFAIGTLFTTKNVCSIALSEHKDKKVKVNDNAN